MVYFINWFIFAESIFRYDDQCVNFGIMNDVINE